MLVLFLIVLMVYGLSTSHTVGLEDDGMFILAMWNGGLAQLASPGRMSLTFYVGQSIIGVPLFYGFGLAWYTGFGPVNALALGLVLWLAQIGMAKWWLARFRYGPLEWLWRSATYLNTDIPWKKSPGNQAS